ncbi:hypothetical protein TNCV_921051 [Trichonephila clavipes]|nr:hypothetical protein TNCV_921051 [Trichonephila clavipes]
MRVYNGKKTRASNSPTTTSTLCNGDLGFECRKNKNHTTLSTGLAKVTEGDDDAVCTAPFTADKDILELLQSSKNIIDADFYDANEMNNTVPVSTSSKMKNIMKSMCSSLDAHTNDEMNNKNTTSIC